jgi:predicted RNase H-like HicB family nuclease
MNQDRESNGMLSRRSEKNRVMEYSYSVKWSAADKVFIARVAEFASLTAHADEPEDALMELRVVLHDVIDDMRNNNEPVPEPLP